MPDRLSRAARSRSHRTGLVGVAVLAVTSLALAMPARAQRISVSMPPNLHGIEPAQLQSVRPPAHTRSAVLEQLQHFPGGSQLLAQVRTTGGSANASASANDASSAISFDPAKAQANATAPWVNAWITYETVNYGYYGYPLVTLRGGQNSDVIILLNPVGETAPFWVVITLDLAGGLNSGFTFQRISDGQTLGSCTRAQVQASGGSSPYGSCMVVIQVQPSTTGIKITPDNFISLLRTTVTRM